VRSVLGCIWNSAGVWSNFPAFSECKSSSGWCLVLGACCSSCRHMGQEQQSAQSGRIVNKNNKKHGKGKREEGELCLCVRGRLRGGGAVCASVFVWMVPACVLILLATATPIIEALASCLDSSHFDCHCCCHCCCCCCHRQQFR